MKVSFATLLVLAPFLASTASALALPEAREFGRGGFGGFNGGNKGGQGNQAADNKGGKGNTGAAASSSAAAATATAAAASGSNADAQTSLTLDSSVICSNFAQNGQAVQEAGQVASLTSTNNFINFCAGKTLTNGQQVTTGSCNPAPMGDIPSTSNQPSAKFSFPTNLANIEPNTPFNITMNIANLETGNFVNAESNYFAAPQQLSSSGQIIGHSHFVVESLTSLTQTTPTDPTKFAFFKGVNEAAVNGALTAAVTAGLPAGTYKVSSINTAANHQPALGPVAQHGSFDDVVYFTVGGAGAGAAAGASNSTGAAAAATSAAAAAGKGADKGNKGGKKNGRRFLRDY